MAGCSNLPSSSSRKIMVVADPTRESAAAVQYALSHSLVEGDTLILLHLGNPNASKNPFVTLFKKVPPTSTTGSVYSANNNKLTPSSVPAAAVLEGELEFTEVLKQACEKAQPKLKVQVEKVALMDQRDKPNLILHHSTYHSVDLLVIGQRRSLSTALLGQKKNGSLRGVIDTAEYLIENSMCSCVAVQRKGQNGGFILDTKTHKNFWLLA